MMPLLTIFTPSYNRADTLPRLYESLRNQTNNDFIWMIIDDGSTDNTRSLVESWQKNDNPFQILYFYKQNGGLHTGYNTAIENCTTDFMMCIDSDDYCPYDAVEKVLDHWLKYGSDRYAGIVGLDYDSDGNCIGDKLPNQNSVNLIDLLLGRYHIVNGDRTNFVRTELYKSVAPMRVFDGEKNFNPHYMHLLISKEYDFLVLNENLRFVEYQKGGMSDSMYKQYYNSPNSFREIRLLYLKFENPPFLFKVKNVIHYISSSILAKKKSIVCLCPKKTLCLVLLLPGFLFSRYIIFKATK